tara:strand:- start:1681 stop:2127 length:447 start_codon:yes stop_codon:yes gene_type:complete
MKLETFEDIQFHVRDRVQDAIKDEEMQLRKKIIAYYLEHNDTDWLNMFEDWLYETQNYIAENLSMYYRDAWNIVNLARFAWTEEDRQYYWDATALVEPDDQDELDDLITKLSHSIVDAIARDELNKQLEPFVSKVVATLQTKLQPHID